MKVEVLLFAGPRELTGQDRAIVEVAAGATYGDLKSQLAAEFAQLAPLVEFSRLAADGQFVDDRAAIGEGVEIALLPPVSGG